MFCYTTRLQSCLYRAAYIGHLTFNWAELAARTAAGGKKRQDDTKARSGNSTRSPLIKEPSAPRPRRPERKHFGARAADKARASPPASTAPGHKHARGPSAAHTAAVTNPEYLLPTGNVESGVHTGQPTQAVHVLLNIQPFAATYVSTFVSSNALQTVHCPKACTL